MKNKILSVLYFVIAIAFTISFRALYMALDRHILAGLGFLVAVLLLSGYLGYWFTGKYIIPYQSTRNTLTRLLLWSNLFSWLIPILGMFTAIATFRIGGHSYKYKDWFRALSVLIVILSLISAVIGLRWYSNSSPKDSQTNTYDSTPVYSDDDPANLFNDKPPINQGSDDPLDLFE